MVLLWVRLPPSRLSLLEGQLLRPGMASASVWPGVLSPVTASICSSTCGGGSLDAGAKKSNTGRTDMAASSNRATGGVAGSSADHHDSEDEWDEVDYRAILRDTKGRGKTLQSPVSVVR
jgi:hypothetical protein